MPTSPGSIISDVTLRAVVIWFTCFRLCARTLHPHSSSSLLPEQFRIQLKTTLVREVTVTFPRYTLLPYTSQPLQTDRHEKCSRKTTSNNRPLTLYRTERRGLIVDFLSRRTNHSMSRSGMPRLCCEHDVRPSVRPIVCNVGGFRNLYSPV